MGIIDSGIVGPFKKKIGPAIGRKHMGQDLILGPYRLTNKKPTADQLTERSKFGMLNDFLSCISSMVNPGFKAYAKKKSAVNAAYSYNSDHAFTEVEGQPVLDYPKIVCSRGQIATPYGLQISADTGVVRFSWHAQQQSQFCQFTDKASFLIYNPSKKRGLIQMNVIDRYALSFDMAVPADFSGDMVYCYICFATADGKRVGDSKYAGSIVI